MSIASEITRIQTAKANIKTAIEAKGVAVPSTTKIDGYPTLIGQISGGGGTSKLPSVIDRSVTTITASDLGNITKIGSYAFFNCTGLTSITIPNSVTSIDYGAFWGCTGLTSVTIGNSVESIDDSAFFGSTNIETATIPTIAISNIRGTKLKSVVINGGTSIGNGAFSECRNLTSITIPNSVTSIGISAFYGCSGLTSITIPDSVTSLDSYAFENCTGLTSVTIPNSVTSIGSAAFLYCSGLTSVIFRGTPDSIAWNAFRNCDNLTDIYVPWDEEEAEEHGEPWSADNATIHYNYTPS